jgi:hypothetical protein
VETVPLISIRGVVLFIALVAPGVLKAQEVKYIDISSVVPRMELRRPPAPQRECKQGTNCIGVGSGSGGGSVTDGAPDQRDPHALGIYLLRVTPTEINPAEPFQVEFKILNTGTVPIELPVSPDLADLQPGDESATFNYSSLALVVRGEVEPWRPDAPLGFVELFGSANQPETMVVLRPGEWIRVNANVKLHTWPSEAISARFRGEFWLRKNTFHPQPGGEFVERNNQYPNSTPTPSVPVRLVPADGSELPKK